MSSASSYNPPCAACKLLRRKCVPECIFSPYFPPEEPYRFANVHKVFGASNVSKLLSEVLPHLRSDAVNSLAYEAEARIRDPVYGCVGAISFLQLQVDRLQKELDAANADLILFSCNNILVQPTAPQAVVGPIHMAPHPVIFGGYNREGGGGGGDGDGDGGGFYHTPSLPIKYLDRWNDMYNNHGGWMDEGGCKIFK